MNLKYYLRGLGLGIIVTALILGIHYSRTSKGMTDAEVKQRAAELGMVENSTLVDTNMETAEDLLKELNEKTEQGDDKTAVSTPEDREDDTDAQENTDDILENDAVDLDTENEEDETVSQEEEASDAEAVTETSEFETVTDAEDDPGKTATAALDEGDILTFTISSGDSSYSVAKKLVQVGLVSDASEYDTYLCTNGYDRYIRTGTYEITSNASNEEIARMITGK